MAMICRVAVTICMIVASGCASQVITMDRTSSGAVDLDTDFLPQTGPDGHYISLPAYPLPNCTDALAYDKLVDDMYGMFANINALRHFDYKVERSKYHDDPTTNTSPPNDLGLRKRAALDFEKILVSSQFAQTMFAFEEGKDSRLLDVQLETLARHGSEGVPSIDRSPFAKLSKDVYRPSRVADLLGSKSDIKQLAQSSSDFALATSQDFDKLLAAATNHTFSASDLAFPSDTPSNSVLTELVKNFLSVNDEFEGVVCAGALKYRDFFGYVDDGHKISWVDRNQAAQEGTLRTLASNLGFRDVCDKQPCWPTPAFSFLHFSDVQIREPGSRLGGAQLSAQLKSLVPSFEQDYTQEQFAMFIYDAIVKTANAEICQDPRRNTNSATCAALKVAIHPDRERPAPTEMINTGDSADTGIQSEFDTFMTYTNKLLVPWYQAIGNHDVLAFGNMGMSSNFTRDRPYDDVCQGWGAVPCTCTKLESLVRNQELRQPDNRGAMKEPLPSAPFTLFPLVLQRLCLAHQIDSDWFVMDPDKQLGGTSVGSFVLSHCQGWHPRPRDGTPTPQLDDCAKREQLRITQESTVVSSDGADKKAETKPDPARYAYAGRPIATPIDAFSCAALDGDASTQRSVLHGFDLGPGFQTGTSPDSGQVLPGYYCFEVATDDSHRRAWAVILNTNHVGGAFGYIDNTELGWLENILPKPNCVLDPDPKKRLTRIGCDDMVMLFAHHPIYTIFDQRQRLRLTDIVTRSPNVIGYFAGHTHESELRVIRPLPGSPGHAKMEIVAPAVIDYPQAAREITIKSVGALGYIEVLTFTPHGEGRSVDKITAAQEGAVRDHCRSIAPGSCDQGRVRLEGRNVTFPRVFFRMPHAEHCTNNSEQCDVKAGE